MQAVPSVLVPRPPLALRSAARVESAPQDRFVPSADPEVGLLQTRFDRGEPETAEDLKRHMARWPTLKAVVAFGPDGAGNTTAIVAGRPEDRTASSLQGMHKVLARLASSPSIKYAAEKHQVGYQSPRQLGPEAVSVRLPGPMDAKAMNRALSEGFAANAGELGVKLPPGRVALLVGGPSGAGKTTLAERIDDMLPDRRAVHLQCDMYYRNWEDPDYPRTPKRSLYWDNPEAMHLDELSRDITQLLSTGKASLPVFDFKTGKRLPERQEVELGENDVLVLDSIFANNPRIVQALETQNLPHVTLFMDTERGEDRLVRRIVRDYEHRGAGAQFTFDCWEETTLPGEVAFVRPTLLQLDPAHDGFYRSQIPTDRGLSVEEIRERVLDIEARGLKPDYDAFSALLPREH